MKYISATILSLIFFIIPTVAGAQTTYITSFTASETTAAPGKQITLNWTSYEISGTNLSIECKEGIYVSFPTYTGSIPCRAPIFPADLPASGNLAVNFINQTPDIQTLTFTLLPAISPKTYDATYSKKLTINIASDILPDPSVASLAASKINPASDEPVILSWTTTYAKSVNIKISCVEFLTATSSQNPAITLPCDKFAFDQDLAASGSLTLSFKNTSSAEKRPNLKLLPSNKAGAYDALRGKELTLIIRPPAPATPLPPPSPMPAPVPQPQSKTPPPPRTPTSQIITPTQKLVFTQTLRQGSRGSEVTALQEFLKKDPALYPEGIVSGYFGPATERAIQRFQARHNIVSSGTPARTGYGAVGPKTRTKLNALK